MTKTTKTKEDSVQFSLAALQAIQSDRIAEEQAQIRREAELAERRIREEEARRLEEERREEAARQARAMKLELERERLASEERRLELQARARIEARRVELELVRAETEIVRAQSLSRPKRRGLPMLLMGAVIATQAVLLAARWNKADHSHVPTYALEQSATEQPESDIEGIESTMPSDAEDLTQEPDPADELTPASEPSESASTKPRRPKPEKPERVVEEERESTPPLTFDCDASDPICGLPL